MRRLTPRNGGFEVFGGSARADAPDASAPLNLSGDRDHGLTEASNHDSAIVFRDGYLLDRRAADARFPAKGTVCTVEVDKARPGSNGHKRSVVTDFYGQRRSLGLNWNSLSTAMNNPYVAVTRVARKCDPIALWRYSNLAYHDEPIAFFEVPAPELASRLVGYGDKCWSHNGHATPLGGQRRAGNHGCPGLLRGVPEAAENIARCLSGDTRRTHRTEREKKQEKVLTDLHSEFNCQRNGDGLNKSVPLRNDASK